MVSESALILFTLLTAAWLAADRSRVRSLLRVCTASGTLAALYGIAQYFGFDPLLPAKAYLIGEGSLAIVRPPGTLGHADYFAAWLVIVVFLSLALGETEDDGWQKWSAYGASGLAAFAVLLTGTRSALLGLVIGLAALLLLRRSRPSRRIITAGALAAICVAGFFISPAGLRLRARLHWSIEDAWGGARLALWKDSLRMALDRPVIGFGPETFAREFPRFESIKLASSYPDFYQESPHNIFLDALTAEGVPGALLLLALCGLGAWCVQRARPDRAVSQIFAGALTAAIVTQWFIVFVSITALYFYLLVAILATQAIPTKPATVARSSWTYWPFAIAASIVFTLFSVHLIVADRALAETQSRIQAGDVSAAVIEYRTVLRWQVKGASADLYYSRSMADLANRAPVFADRLEAASQAVEAGVRATKTSEDRQNAWYNLAMLRARENDANQVEQSLRNAIAAAPHWFKPHWTLAQLLERMGRSAEALSESRLAVELDGGHDAEVLDTWNLLNRKHTGSR